MFRTCLTTAISLGFFCTGALAQGMINAHTPTSVAGALQDLGYKAQLTTDSVGDPMIKSATGGVNFTIFFYGCSDNAACQDIQFSAGFDTDSDADVMLMNTWNNKFTIGTAMVDDEKDPVFQHFVAGVTDMSAPSFKRLLGRWETALGDFTDHIDW